MARAFRCKECGIGVSTTGNNIPPPPSSICEDNSKCELVEVESKLNADE